MRTCSSCKKYISRSAWDALPYVGVQDFNDGFPSLELRNHDCGSTLAEELPLPAVTVPPAASCALEVSP